ncbi:DUF3599 family protein [Sporomusa sp.]|uniref:DUF3599 family protein n=1 Tax=Sporomusa sp. TaxID=2078658 RepID=UPI002CBA7F8F|nr:DUF3599 family protein [Sporomusa sp.]HWR07104.1 DUF3599 family protein [Sporomusa sp.]
MSFRSLLTDKCDVYHLVETTTSPGYGLPGETEYSYPDVPDAVDVPCKFTEKGQSITQGEPGAEIVHSFAVSFLISADVRLNDKTIFNGVEFKTQIPRRVKNHHIEVVVTRKGNL